MVAMVNSGAMPASQADITTLANINGRGWQEANKIVWKLCQKYDDGSLNNPSAFVHKCSKTARQLCF